jgi:hypothetical protein
MNAHPLAQQSSNEAGSDVADSPQQTGGIVAVLPQPQPVPRLRIAMFGSRGIPHTYGGAEAFLEELAPRLAARGDRVLP